jgi:hypothetical protein
LAERANPLRTYIRAKAALSVLSSQTIILITSTSRRKSPEKRTKQNGNRQNNRPHHRYFPSLKSKSTNPLTRKQEVTQGSASAQPKPLSTSLKYHVIIGSRTPSKGSQAVLDVLTSSPNASISTVQLGVTDQASIKAAAAHVEKEFGRLDVLINIAGIINRNPNLLENLRAVFETNAFGPAVVTGAFLPLLEKRKDARLVYVSSC